MARFSQTTIQEVAGFDNQILAEELLWGVDDYWDVTFTQSATDTTPVDLTGWTFTFRLIRRSVTDIVDVRNKGIELIGLGPASGATELNLDSNVKLVNVPQGKIRMLINDTIFNQIQPVIDTTTPPVYTGYLGATLPAQGDPASQSYIPPQTKKIMLLFIIRSDGIAAQTA